MCSVDRRCDDVVRYDEVNVCVRTFAIIAAAIISGAVVERIRFSAYAIFIVAWVLAVYVPLCHWIWGGGWIAEMGAKDCESAESDSIYHHAPAAAPCSWLFVFVSPVLRTLPVELSFTSARAPQRLLWHHCWGSASIVPSPSPATCPSSSWAEVSSGWDGPASTEVPPSPPTATVPWPSLPRTLRRPPP